jgi:outer membrane protein assembly factor BamB
MPPREYALSDHVTLYGINVADGHVQWKVGAENKYGTPRVLIEGNAVFLSTDKRLLAMELATGRQLWNFSADEIQGDLSADEQHVYMITHKGSFARPRDTLHALALTTGQEKWSQELSGLVYSSLVHDGVVYAGREHLHAMDAATGRQLWSFKGTGRETPRLISGDRIFLTSPTTSYVGLEKVDQGYLYAIDAKTGKLKP